MPAKKHNKQSGFTLIELIVAVGIFGLIVSMVFGVFVFAAVSQRRIIALRNVEDNLRFAVESMSKEMRTGKNFDAAAGSISFTNAKSQAVIYRLNNGIIEKSSDGGASYSAITGSETIIDYLNFYLMGQAAGDGLQPRITITAGATSQVGNQSANLKIQTTVSERFLQS
ncbi:type II secretion system protein [Candidatus Azambacteria bacterium]|nr:type II secretion system protein [Candidatus Azambacteria bacterium]